MNMVSTTRANAVLPAPSAATSLPHRAVDSSATGYLAAVTPALESALANAHEAGHERAVRILHAVLAILDDPSLR
ncbi:hypothetical protein [Neoroseomonas lacus]|uniref:Uncharacterized protein n=1 Tax=Neoroseomonas lacus TaxID=287609 RepID=A0A917K412_9PROT|nr:hypothetical protein [Neoroseomonas lacus]GGJ00250.1 hypothetical protein GCM10011320_03810 [Neoroseomonas lacus]